MMNNKERYNKEISEQNSYYKVTIKEFINWLKENNEFEWFKIRILNNENFYNIATNYSIPVIMIKYLGFKKAAC